MIVYSGTLDKFNKDVDYGVISDLVKQEFKRSGIKGGSDSEISSWDQSLLHMKNVLSSSNLDKNINVAIEYQIPSTSKRVDFLIAGMDEFNKNNVVIVELKQWQKAVKTDKESLVSTYLGGRVREVTHPSYQAYSYAKTIENYNEYVQTKDIGLIPCSFLHNYQEEYRYELEDIRYEDILNEAPIFLKRDGRSLAEFINKHITKPSDVDLLYKIEHGKIKPSKALQDSISSLIKGNKEFHLLDEQMVVYANIKRVIEKSKVTNDKYTIIVQGGPGTGKSVLAINLLAEFKELVSNYITKNAAPKNVFKKKLKQNNFKNVFIDNLFKGSGSYIDCPKNTFDLLLVDEAHRLNKKSGIYANLGENQVMEIINAARVSVFFIDEDQMVTTKDFGTIEEIKLQANELGSKVITGEDFILTSQFRCNGSDGYIAFLNDLLEIRSTANNSLLGLDYDLRVYDNPNEMREDLRQLNNINNKTRMIAGYTYDWVSKKDPSLFDITLKDNFKAKWNFSNTATWAIDDDSFDQVGCIHTSQGLEFDYVGIIIGKDLILENNQVVTKYKNRAKTDQSLKGTKKTQDYQLADKIIRNTYKTLMTRGQKGCYIYCEDKALSEYIKSRLNN